MNLVRFKWSYITASLRFLRLDDSCSYVMREDVYALDEEDASWLLATAVQKQVTITKEELESTMEALGNAPKKKSLAAFLRTQSKLDVKKRTLIYDYWREKRRVCIVE